MPNERKTLSKVAIRQICKKLLRELDINTAPIKLGSILDHLEISLDKANPITLKGLGKISAFIDLEDKIIVYNDSHPAVRQRFSIAHEIGHLVLGHKVLTEIFNLNSKDAREIEANTFAAELLMPFDWLKQDLVSKQYNIKILAEKYWVSEEAMGWRIFNSDGLLLRK
jgi:Zn-dependent peptidase ImmA (M78 family)